MYSYMAYGLVVQSEYELPELIACEREPDVVIRPASIDVSPPEKTDTETGPIQRTDGRWIVVNPGEVTLCWEDVGKFQIKNENEILVDADAKAEERLVRLFILGASLGILLLQRRFAVFHSGMLGADDHAVALIGGKAAGKSTLSAALIARGFQLISDDLLVFSPEPGVPLAQPGIPQLKLWPESIEGLGGDPEDYPVLHSDVEKRAQRLKEKFVNEALPLKQALVLAEGPEPAIRRLSPQQALVEIMPHWYGARFGWDLLNELGRVAHLKHCAAIISHVPVYRFERPRDLDVLEASADILERHLADKQGT